MYLALADFSSHMISASIDVPPVYRLHTISAGFLICSTASCTYTESQVIVMRWLYKNFEMERVRAI